MLRKQTTLRYIMAAVLSLLICGISLAQSKVSGVVKDKMNEPIIGATVLVKGNSSVGTITDIDGKYSLTLPANAKIIVFSYVGMKAKEVEAKAGVTNITMEDSATDLDELIVIGYGVQRKRDLTGSVASVGESTLKDIPVTTAAEAITGRLVGVQVTTTEGSPDAEISIKVRGGGSISQDNSPLYVVDGFPVSSINNISPSDIENMTVLKDASSTAIYGARGANGVIEITTKSGKEGRVSVSLNAYAGIKQITKYLGVLSPYEYVKYQHEIDQTSTFTNYYGEFDDMDIYKSIKGTNWQKEIFGQTGIQQYYNVGINGGTKMSKYNLSLTRNDEKSIMIGSDYERTNLNFKMNTEISKTVSLDFNTRMAYTVVNGAGVSSGSGATTKLRNAIKYAPTKGLREFSSNVDDDEDITPESASLLYNPVESTLDEYKNQKRFVGNYNGAINWKILKELTFRSEFGYEINFNKTDVVNGPSTSSAKNYGGKPIAVVNNEESTSWRWANTVTWNKMNVFPRQNINILLGQELVSSVSKLTTNESRFFPIGMKAEDVLSKMSMGTPIPTVSKFGQMNNLASFFARVNYNVFDKYMATITVRGDGSSKFAPGNQWGVFPSAALAWRINDEEFMKSADWLSNLKLRLSMGAAGNNRISDGLWMLTYSTSSENKPYFPNETEASQLIPNNTLYNPNLKWETTLTRNIGVDYGFFNGRLSGAIDVYWNTTKDLLIQQPIATSSGYEFQMMNIGQTSNKGIEFTVEGAIVQNKNFKLNASFNIAFNKNNVEKFSNGDQNWKTYSSGWNGTATPTEDFIVREGEPLGQMYGYVADGMYSFDDFTFNSTTNKWDIKPGIASTKALISGGDSFGPGSMKLKDLDENGIIDNNDKTVIGCAQPIHTGGFNLSAQLYNWDMGAFFNWSVGNKVYNANKLDYSAQLLSRKYQNLSNIMSSDKRFTIIDPTTGLNVANGSNANPDRLKEINQNASIWSPLFTSTVLSSWAIEDGSFLRLNNLTIGYTLPKKLSMKARIQNLRFYVTGYNLFTFTNYSGYDPEVSTRRSTPLTPSVDYSAYPKSRSFIAGINVTF